MSSENPKWLTESWEEIINPTKKVLKSLFRTIAPFLLSKLEQPKPEGLRIYRILKHLGLVD